MRTESQTFFPVTNKGIRVKKATELLRGDTSTPTPKRGCNTGRVECKRGRSLPASVLSLGAGEELGRADYRRMVLSQAADIQLHRSLECSLCAVRRAVRGAQSCERKVDLTANMPGASGGCDVEWYHAADR